MSYTKPFNLGEYLLQEGIITSEKRSALESKRMSTHERLCEVLAEEGCITEGELAEIFCKETGHERASADELQPSPEAAELLSERAASKLLILPLYLEGSDKITVAMSDPTDVRAIDELESITKRKAYIRVAEISEIKSAINRHYRLSSSLKEALAEASIRDKNSHRASSAKGKAAESVNLNHGAENSPVARMLDSMIEQAVRDRASDIHIEPSEKSTRVRFRVDGALRRSIEIPAHLHSEITARVKILSGMDIAEKRRPQDGRILTSAAGTRLDIRVSTLPSIFGEKTVLRILDRNEGRIGLELLGFDERQCAKLRESIKAPSGIILATGPTGSGKSTTLYSLLKILNDPTKNIITLEDPVEFTVAGITQVQVNEKIGVTFGGTLRSVLRQDPDIIMVGEIRDTETAQLAVRVALTGHLVLSTLHTNDALTAVNRLVDMGVPRFLISSSLRAVLAQRLVRRLCPHCKEKITVNSVLSAETGLAEGSAAYRPKGCRECGYTGYKGRTAVAEILNIDDNLRTMINEGASEKEMRNYARSVGMTTLREDAALKVSQGVTSIDEMLFSTMMN